MVLCDPPIDYIALLSQFDLRVLHFFSGGANSGTTRDWMKGGCGAKFSYTLELRDTGTWNCVHLTLKALKYCV